jgi:hypothetical protein
MLCYDAPSTHPPSPTSVAKDKEVMLDVMDAYPGGIEQVLLLLLLYKSGSAVFDRRCSLTGMIDIRHLSARQ